MNDVRKKLKIKDFNNTELFLAINTSEVEFDIYSEAKAYIDEYTLMYEEPKYVE